MTVENLHDAIGLLPSDLIAKVDEKRARKPKVIPFKQYAVIAACLVLVLGSSFLLTRLASGGAKETAAEAPAAIMQAPEEAANEAAPLEQHSVSGSAGTPAEEEPACAYPPIETHTAAEIPPEGEAEETVAKPAPFPAEDVQYADTRNIGTACTTSEPVIRVLRSPTELEDFRFNFGYYDQEAFDDRCKIYDESWFESHDLLVILVKEIYRDGTFSLASVTESDNSWCVRFYSGGPYTGERVDRFVLAALEKGRIPEGSSIFAMFELP